MSTRILRRLKAAEDAESIANYIAQHSLTAALRFLENLQITLKELADTPGGGSRFESLNADLANLRFRRVQGFPNHVIFFFEHEKAIEVVRILHGAQDLDTELTRP